MLSSTGIVFILLLPSLWWTRSNSSTTPQTPLTHQGTSHQPDLVKNTGRTPFAINHRTSTMANKNATAKSTATESNTQSNSAAQRSANGTELFLTPHVAKGSTNGTNNSGTDIKTISPSSTISITISDSSTVTESNVPTSAGVSLKTETRNFIAVTHKTNSTATISTKDSQKSSTAVTAINSPSNTLAKLPTSKSGNVTTGFKTISQTTNVHWNFTNHSIVPSNPKQPSKENHSKAGVVLGATIGAILGSALISLAGYLICGKRTSGLFSHQRLYDDTRSEPVLRLDNSSYDVGIGDLSYYNPSPTNESSAQNSRGRSYDGIPMGDMTSSQPPA